LARGDRGAKRESENERDWNRCSIGRHDYVL
jgi:hypothetical protein